MDSIQKVAGVIGILIVSLSIAFYFIIFIPQRESTQRDTVRKCQKEITEKMKELKNATIKGYDFGFVKCMRENGYR